MDMQSSAQSQVAGGRYVKLAERKFSDTDQKQFASVSAGYQGCPSPRNRGRSDTSGEVFASRPASFLQLVQE
jgi:hypothetical protein